MINKEALTQQDIAVRCLKKLDIYQPYITRFAKDSMPTFFERYCGYYADQEPVLWDRVKKIQEERNCLVYAITHDFFEFGECWSLMCIPKDVECAEDCITNANSDTFYVFAYVYNEDYPELSEAGDIVVKAANGGIRRIG